MRSVTMATWLTALGVVLSGGRAWSAPEGPTEAVNTSWEVDGGWVLDGATPSHRECASCTGADACGTYCLEANGDGSTCGVAGPACRAGSLNVARGLSFTTASSTYGASYSPRAATDGDRRGLGTSVAPAGYWNDATRDQFPDGLTVEFYNGARPISEVDVYTLQDACGVFRHAANCLEPTDTLAFSAYGVTDFRVQAWNGSAFVDVPGGAVTGNRRVKRTIKLSSPVTTSKIRVVVDGALNGYSRLVEVEAWQDRSAFDPYLTEALNTRIAMTGATGCATTPTATTINGVTGYFKRCSWAWVVASPGNGAWLLPQSYISDLYLGGTVWPASPTAAMSALGFPRGAYHGADASDNYVVFERGILAKSNTHATVRRIGGLGDLAANAALAKAWLEARFADKYPVTDTQQWACTDTFCTTSNNRYPGYGFRFSTEGNWAGYNSTFLVQAGATSAFHLDGEIENKWQTAPPSVRRALGWPIANETRTHANGSAVSQFTGGAILWHPVACGGGAFGAEIVTGSDDQPNPLYAEGLTGLRCANEVAEMCVDGGEMPFAAEDGTAGTYQFACGSPHGWWDRIVFRWTEDGEAVVRRVKAPILGKYLNTDPEDGRGRPIAVEQAIDFGRGLPLGNAYNHGDHTRQDFQNGSITDSRPCADVCTTAKACSLDCTEAGQRTTCGRYKPAGYEHGKCQLYDVYCELPEITGGTVRDNSEDATAEAFFYYGKPGGGPEKRGRMPVQLGGVGGAPLSEYRQSIWEQGILGIQPDQFPFASNFLGPAVVVPDDGRLQLEFTASGPAAFEPVVPHPVLASKQCRSVRQTAYGVHPPPPAFPASSMQHLYEDDECKFGICNSDDYLGSIRLYHGDCAAQHWNQGRDFGFTGVRQLTNETPANDPDVGGPGHAGSYFIDEVRYRTYCYRGLNLPWAGPNVLDTWEYGIGSSEYPGFVAP
jgi:hypothetical protein